MKNCPCCGHLLDDEKIDTALIMRPDLLTFSFKGADLDITPQQYQCLRMLFDRIGDVLTRQTYFDEMIGYEYDGETRTFDLVISKVRKAIKPAKVIPKKDRVRSFIKVKDDHPWKNGSLEPNFTYEESDRELVAAIYDPKGW